MPDTQPASAPTVPFEIGLVMAGAISAGAYTAGAIDFLIEALDEWEKEKAFAREHPDDPRSRECPMHDVRLKAMAGSSAGGMTAGLAAGLLAMKYESVKAQPPPGRVVTPVNNNLYRSWVNSIDIVPLLGVSDLEQGGDAPLRSVLDSSILSEIARDAFKFEKPGDRARRPYVADPFHVLLTVTNLRGVPYIPSLSNVSRTMEAFQRYQMKMHADYMHFVIGDAAAKDDGAFRLKPYDFANPETWGVLQSAALATGAFPVGLAPVRLRRSPAQYGKRRWPMPGPHDEDGRHYCQYWREIAPYWPRIDKAVKEADRRGEEFPYEFLCVDGGVMNNEPLDLVRQVLTGPGESDLPEGSETTRAILMILPFPESAPFEAEYDGRTSLVGLLGTTFSALMSQARFRPQELALADDPDIYCRYLIVPRRGYRPDGTPEPYTIACGSVEGFGGFLSRKFREHDYQLGRRNCQWFLKQYFGIPTDRTPRNPILDSWTPEALEEHRILKAGRGGMKDGKEVPLALARIIPLYGTAATDVPPPTWPKLTEADLEALRPRVKERLGSVVHSLVNHNVEGFLWGPLARGALKSAWWFQRNNAVDSVISAIRKDLSMRGLMAGK